MRFKFGKLRLRVFKGLLTDDIEANAPAPHPNPVPACAERGRVEAAGR